MPFYILMYIFSIYRRSQVYSTASSPFVLFRMGSRKLWPDMSPHPNHKDRVGGDREIRTGSAQPACALLAIIGCCEGRGEVHRWKEATEAGKEAQVHPSQKGLLHFTLSWILQLPQSHFLGSAAGVTLWSADKASPSRICCHLCVCFKVNP